MTTGKYEELIRRLTEGDGMGRELDIAILEVLRPDEYQRMQKIYEDTLARAIANGLTNRNDACRSHGFSGCPTFTYSMDAALSLVERMLPGKELEIWIGENERRVTIYYDPMDPECGLAVLGEGTTKASTPRAFLIALLEALSASLPPDKENAQ